MFHYILACVIIVASVEATGAAAPRSLDQFIGSALGDFKVTLQKKNQEEFGKSSGFKPIESIQLTLARNESLQRRRSQSEVAQGLPPRNLYVDDREIALRIKPRGPGQLKILGSLNEGQNRIESLATQNAITKALLERYEAAAGYAMAFEKARSWDAVVDLKMKRLSMLQAAARSSAAKASDLIKERTSLEEAEVTQGLARSELRLATSRLKLLDANVGELKADAGDLVTPVEMLKVISDISPQVVAPASELAKEKAARARQSASYEIAKDERIVEFVEASYSEAQESRLYRDDRQFGIKVGFNIPGFASSELSRSEKSRELVKYEVEAREAQREDAIVQSAAKEDLANAAALYKSMTALENQPSEQRLRRLVNHQDPLLAATIEEDGLRRSLRKIEVSKRAFGSYLKFLASSGALAEKSTTNFLSRDLRKLEL